jgi:anti-sigma B factor antagonist
VLGERRQPDAACLQVMCDHRAMDRLDVKVQTQAEQMLLVLHGELDMATESQLHNVAMAQLAAHNPTRLRLDLADISFLDSSGIKALLDIRQHASNRGIDVEIVAVSRRAARVLTIVGLAEPFGIPADPDSVPGQSPDSEA